MQRYLNAAGDPIADFRARLDQIDQASRERLRRDLTKIAGIVPTDIASQPLPTPAEIRDTFAPFDARQADGNAAGTLEGFSAKLDNRVRSSRERWAAIAQADAHPSAAQTFERGWRQLDQLLFDAMDPQLSRQQLGQTIYASRAADFIEPLIAHAGLPRSKKADLARRIEAMVNPPRGMYVPGSGCVLYGPAFGSHANADVAWQDTQTCFTLVDEIGQQRLGRGFLLEYTRYGAAAQARGGWKANLCRRLDIVTADAGLSPEATAQMDAIYGVSRFTRSGWRSYITERAHRSLGQTVWLNPCSALDLCSVVMGITSLVAGPLQAIAVNVLFFFLKRVLLDFPSLITAERINTCVVALQGMNTAFSHIFNRMGQESMGVAIGRLMLHRIDPSNGGASVSLAAHAVSLALENAEALFEHDKVGIEALARRQPLANPDARLAMLCMLPDITNKTRDGLRDAARSRWGM